MSRPVPPEEAEPGALPAPREGVTVRRVAKHDDGLPVAQDLQTVHQMLEESFADHFQLLPRELPEFVQRLREDPGHRWDHWWIAEIDVDGEQVPGGALVSSVLRPDSGGVEGSYIDYIGVHRRARGRGVAKALLHTVIADTASAVVTASASRSTRTRPPAPTGSTARWAGRPPTRRSPGTATSRSEQTPDGPR